MIKDVIDEELNKCGIISNRFNDHFDRLLGELIACSIWEVVDAVECSAKFMGDRLEGVYEDFFDEQHFCFVAVLLFLWGMHSVNGFKEISCEVSSEEHSNFLFPKKYKKRIKNIFILEIKFFCEENHFFFLFLLFYLGDN